MIKNPETFDSICKAKLSQKFSLQWTTGRIITSRTFNVCGEESPVAILKIGEKELRVSKEYLSALKHVLLEVCSYYDHVID